MRRGRDARWNTAFGSFVRGFTVGRLCTEFRARGYSVTRAAVSNWIAGRNTPSPEHAGTIETVSGGSVRLQDVYRHRHEMRGAR
jgi:DNA-binding transcriptional regulator YdaS (Cro superfamily)